jgi:phosphonate transport system substrate-binding protein
MGGAARFLAGFGIAVAISFGGVGAAWAETYSFGVLSRRSVVLTAQYWPPILDYVKAKTGVQLNLGRLLSPASSGATGAGDAGEASSSAG